MNIPDHLKSLWSRIGKSRAVAIRAKCLECCCFQKREAMDCRVPDCPLFNWNPYRKGQEGSYIKEIPASAKRTKGDPAWGKAMREIQLKRRQPDAAPAKDEAAE